jgi:hypothetical protein
LETAPVPIDDKLSKDLTINWKMFDSFDPNGTFYTDSNGLEMQTRQVKNWTAPGKQYNLVENELGFSYLAISGNYYPVDSAIAMRDKSGLSSIQVTVMNDRA